MPSFATGLVNAASAGLSGAMQGKVESTRALLLEKRRKEAAALAAQAAARADEKQQHQEEQDRIKNLTMGYTPGSTSITAEPPAAPATPPPPSFAAALEQGMGATSVAAPPQASPLTQPVREGSLGAVPHVRVVNTPESYDPSKSAAAAQIGARGDQSRLTAADQHMARLAEIAIREQGQDRRAGGANATRIKVAEIGAAGRNGRGGGGGALTANGQETGKKTMLDGLMAYHGTEAALRQYLQESPAAQGAMARLGITDADITAAVGRATGKRVDAVVRTDPRHPERAAARTDSARTAVVARMQGLGGTAPKTPTTKAAGTETPPKQPAAHSAAPGASTPPQKAAPSGGVDVQKESAQYQQAVAKITTTFAADPTERDRRLAAAKKIYEGRVSGAARP